MVCLIFMLIDLLDTGILLEMARNGCFTLVVLVGGEGGGTNFSAEMAIWFVVLGLHSSLTF